jgi:hypothetical protein
MPGKYDNRFKSEEKEITVLMKDRCSGASVFEKKWLIPAAYFAALYDEETGELKKGEGRIEWLIKRDPGRKGFGYDFEQYGIYKLLVRQSVYVESTYMLVRILESDVQNEKLLAYRNKLAKPVVIKTTYGTFTLDRSMSWFSSDNIVIGEHTVFAALETDAENGNTAKGALQAFSEIAGNFETFDRKNKEYAAEQLLDLANEWLADKEDADTEQITKEMFISSMEISELTVSPDGSVTLYYKDGDMFWGHSIEISVDADGTVSDANIAG